GADHQGINGFWQKFHVISRSSSIGILSQDGKYFPAPERSGSDHHANELEATVTRLLQFFLHGRCFGGRQDSVLDAMLASSVPLQNHTDFPAAKRRVENRLPAILVAFVAGLLQFLLQG